MSQTAEHINFNCNLVNFDNITFHSYITSASLVKLGKILIPVFKYLINLHDQLICDTA